MITNRVFRNGEKDMLKKIIVNSLLLVMILSVGTSCNIGEEKFDFDNYEIENSTEAKYIERLAKELGVSFEEAYEINKKENQELLKKYAEELKRTDVVVKYKEHISSQKIINSNNELYIVAEIKYIYLNDDKKAVEIIEVEEPYMYVLGAATISVDGGEFNVENNGTSARISRTCSLTYDVTSDTDIFIGGEILGIKKTSSKPRKSIITTEATTYVMNIQLKDL